MSQAVSKLLFSLHSRFIGFPLTTGFLHWQLETRIEAWMVLQGLEILQLWPWFHPPCSLTWQSHASSCQAVRYNTINTMYIYSTYTLNPPAPKVLGRDLPDGTRKRLQVYLGGGEAIFRPKPPVFDRSWRSPSKNTVKNSTEDTCSWTRPSKIGKRKSEKNPCFSTFWLQFFGFATSFFAVPQVAWPGGGFLSFLDPFSDWFSSFCDSRNTGFYSVFLFSACLTASFKTSKNLVNYAVLCYGVNENIVNTSVFWRWLKKTL